MALLFAVIGVLFVAGITGILVLSLALRPIEPENNAIERFVIAKGQGSAAIGTNLTEAGLIRHPLLFRFTVWQTGLANRLQAGSFELSPNMSVSEIAQTLTQGTEDIWVTVLEGWRVEEIADMMAAAELESFDEQEFLSLAQGKEGYLFPDTYLVPRQITAAQFLSLLENTFEQKVTEGLADEVAASDRSLEEIIIMASLVQREAKSESDMRHVAGILWNRVDLGMSLDVDATLQYITTKQAVNGEWWPQPNVAAKQINSPYNTYRNPGLPAGAIANPGVQAISATATPLDTKDLFYLHDRQGIMRYATTLEEHNRNVQQYLR